MPGSPSAQPFFEKISYNAALWSGSSWAFLIALTLTLGWLVSGPFFSYSDGWQLVMNTVSNVCTFLIVFLLQRSQVKDTLSMQIKLNEIIAAIQGANNSLINIEELSEGEILALRKRYQNLASKIQQGPVSTQAMSTINVRKN